jgi:hypothetical protein
METFFGWGHGVGLGANKIELPRDGSADKGYSS